MKIFSLTLQHLENQTRFANKYELSFAQAGIQIEIISRMGHSEGLDF